MSLAQYQGSRFVIWIRLKVDPHANLRGFSILDRELRVEGYEPVNDTMQDLRGETMQGKFWVVKEDEVYRVIPELLRFQKYGKAWLFPVEFCDPFVRPYNYLSFKVKETDLLSDDE
jgi:hypothetical protein